MDSQIIKDCLRDYQNAQNIPVVVKDVIPVLWFGDEKAYRKSNLKIVTVGINPSFSEFEDKSHLTDVNFRFPGITTYPSIADYEKAMNGYFWNNPYKKWFNPIEQALNTINASFGGKMSSQDFGNAAIHIDYHAPVATKPVWSHLCPLCVESLTNSFSKYFDSLVSELQPDIMIMFGSVGANFVKTRCSDAIKQTTYRTAKGKEYHLARYNYQLGNKTVKIITTPYWSIPFSPYKIAEVCKDLPTLL